MNDPLTIRSTWNSAGSQQVTRSQRKVSSEPLRPFCFLQTDTSMRDLPPAVLPSAFLIWPANEMRASVMIYPWLLFI
jgi:hypothetical protein